ncbi:hypothetical protein Neosp_011304 [[Neocosmospora] mangrovei]
MILPRNYERNPLYNRGHPPRDALDTSIAKALFDEVASAVDVSQVPDFSYQRLAEKLFSMVHREPDKHRECFEATMCQLRKPCVLSEQDGSKHVNTLMQEVAKKNAHYVFTLPPPAGLAAFTVSEVRGIGSQSKAHGASMIRTEDVFQYLRKSIDVFKREHKGAVCVGQHPVDATANRDLLLKEAMARSHSLLWTPWNQKAHIVLPNSVNLTSEEFVAQNQHWLDLVPRLPGDQEALEVVKEQMLKNIEDTAQLLPEQYRAILYFLCGSMNNTTRQGWLGQGFLQEVIVNRPVPLPKMVETHPLRQAALKLEKVAHKLKKKNPADAVELKHLSDSITLICDVLYHEEIKAKTHSEAMAVQMDKTLQKLLQLIDGPALTANIDRVNEEHQKKLNSPSAQQMTDREWLHCYRNMGDAQIQEWVDHFVGPSGIEAGIPETWKALVMQTGGDRLWRDMGTEYPTYGEPKDVETVNQAILIIDEGGEELHAELAGPKELTIYPLFTRS